MATFNVPISLPGTLLKSQTTLQFGLWKLQGVGNFYVKRFGLHWVKSGQPRTPIKINQAQPAIWAGIWAGDGNHLLGPAGSPLVQVGLEGQGFSDAIPYTLYDFWGPDSIWAGIVNNTTNLQVYCSVTGVADWSASEPATTVVAVQTTASSSTVVITNSPAQVVV